MIQFTRATGMMILWVIMLTLRAHAGAGMPECAFVYQAGDSFNLAVSGPGDTFYAVGNGQIWHVDEHGKKLADFSNPFFNGSGITGLSRDASTGEIFVSGILIYQGGTSSVVKLKADGTIASSFAGVSVVDTFADDPGDAAYLPCIVPDGSGGCYIGGPFTQINGAPATGLAHLNSGGRFQSMARINPSTESPLFIALASDGLVVVQTSVIYKDGADGVAKALVQAEEWNYIVRATYDSSFGLAIAGQTYAGAKIFVYDLSGKKLPSFNQDVAFVTSPSVLAWDRCGNLLVANAQLITSSDDPRGVKRLLPSGDLDSTWSRTLSVVGVGGLIPLDHSVIISGAFDTVDNYPISHVARLSGDYSTGQIANQSILGPVQGGKQQIVFGVVLKGDFYVDVLLRASGPSLAQFGVAPTPSTTVIDLYHGNTLVQHIVAGKVASQRYNESSTIAALTPAVGAFQLVTHGYDEAEALVTLAPGSYTAVVDTIPGQSGTVLAEAYYP